jgi:hypothetical protein
MGNLADRILICSSGGRVAPAAEADVISQPGNGEGSEMGLANLVVDHGGSFLRLLRYSSRCSIDSFIFLYAFRPCSRTTHIPSTVS